SPIFEEVQEYIAQRKLTRRVHLLGRRNDVPNLLAGFDLFALATEQEAAGMVFVEAAAAGLAVVGTDVDGVPEMMENGETGLLVPLHDQQALTEALRTLIDDPVLRKKMGDAGRRRVLEEGRFTPQAMVNSIESCYLRWLSERQ
uniref:glycosyltransferase n=1 Tax=Pusillimonas sp. (ex Stolz et al. 2005) TaxID=1979962 RepID=UPI0026146FD9